MNQLDDIVARQEALIGVTHDLAELHQVNHAAVMEMLTKIEGWLSQPPSSDLPDLIRQLVTVVMTTQKQMMEALAGQDRIEGKIGAMQIQMAALLRRPGYME